MTVKETLDVVRPYCPTLLWAIRQAWREWIDWIPSEARKDLDGASRGLTIWERAWALMRNRLADNESLRFESYDGIPVIHVVGTGIRIKFNRVDNESYRPRNALTTNNLDQRAPLLFDSDEWFPGIVTLAFTATKVAGLYELDKVMLVYEMVDSVELLAYLDGPGGLGELALPPSPPSARSPQVRLKSIPSGSTSEEKQAT